jgi:hypothetical protein
MIAATMSYLLTTFLTSWKTLLLLLLLLLLCGFFRFNFRLLNPRRRGQSFLA